MLPSNSDYVERRCRWCGWAHGHYAAQPQQDRDR